ncbi:hypothetical protein E8E11_003705 [Didymella keratinophila]|nr:hypothetical protein E8E11_003705 [Didymella keratinophila]
MLSVYDKTPLMGHGSIHFPDIRNPIANVLVVSSADGTAASIYLGEPPVAQECVVSCSPATNGTEMYYTENVEISVDNATEKTNSLNFGMTNDTAYNIMAIFDDVFPSFYTAKDNHIEPVFRFWTWKDGPAYSRKLHFNPWLAPNNITLHMEKLALAISNTIRSVGTNNSVITGKAYSNMVFVDVRWEWLTFPLVLLLLSIIFLVATIVKTSDGTTAGLWKTSAMPTLIYGLPKETQDHLQSASSWQSNETKTVRIKLLPSMGWRVSGQSFLNKPPVLPLRKAQPPPGWI